MTAMSELNFDKCIARLTSSQAALWGFRTGKSGAHAGRTIMLKELALLLQAVPPEADRKAYASAIVADNCLGKRTATTRRESLKRLTELYALESRAILFRVFRDFWIRDEKSRPLLAVFLALARDALLRPTFAAVQCTPFGSEFTQQSLKEVLVESVGDRLNEVTLATVVRNAASSWTQSGHLRGHRHKTRQKVQPTPAATTFALLLGFAMGRRGRLLFETPWVGVLDATPDAVIEVAFEAKRLGMLELKQSGALINASFLHLLTEKEQEEINGTH